MEKWTKRILSLVLALLLLCGVVSAGMIQASAANLECAIYPMDYVNCYNTHGKKIAYDLNGKDSGKDDVFAPFTGTIMAKFRQNDSASVDYGNVVFLQSDNKVIWADGREAFMTISVAHADYAIFDKLKVGDKIKQGDVFYREGTIGPATGNHVHMEIFEGKHAKNTWRGAAKDGSTGEKIEKALYLLTSTIVVSTNANKSNLNGKAGLNWNTLPYSLSDLKGGVVTTPTLTGLVAKNITNVSARLEATLSPSISMSEHGIYIGKKTDSTLTQVKGGQSGTITFSGTLWFEVGTKHYKELTPGTEYQYYFYVVSGGKTYKSDTKYFTTSGQTSYRVSYFANYSGKNYISNTDFTWSSCTSFQSRDASVYTLSTDSGNLVVVGKSAGSSGKDLRIYTQTNAGTSDAVAGVGDNKSMTLSFYAKSSVSGAKMYWRWGYQPTSEYKSITLTTTWTKYTIRMDKTTSFGDCLHPYFDKAGTFYINELQLEDGTAATAYETEWASIESGFSFVTQGAMYESLPNDTTRTGYDFLGWYTAKRGGTKITTTTSVVAGNRKLYAQWASIPIYTLTYNANGGSGTPASQATRRDIPVTIRGAVPERDGYEFLGWWDESEIGEGASCFQPGDEYYIDSNMTLYAIWAEIQTIEPSNILFTDVPATAYVSDDESGDWWYFTPKETGTYRFQSTLGVQTSCQLADSNDNYIGGDFDSDGDFDLIVDLIGGETYTFIVGFRYGTGLSGSIPMMVTAYEGPPIFTQTISYHANGGSGAPEPETFSGENGVLSMLHPQRFGYSFIGWSRFQDTTNPYVILYPGQSVVDDTNSDALYYAIWKPAETLTAGTAVTATIQFGYQQLWYKFTPATTGRYEFYSGSASGTDPMATLYSATGEEMLQGDDELGFPNFSIQAGLTAGTTYYLETHSFGSGDGSYSVAEKSATPYVPTVFTLTYNANGGTGAPPAEQHNEMSPFALSAIIPIRTNHTFLGWAESRFETEFSNLLPPSTVGCQLPFDVTLYAIWERIEASTTFVLTVVSGSGSGSYAAGAGVTITANAAPSGKVFDKWTATAGGFANANSASTTFTMPAGAATVTATYKDAPTPPTPKKYIFSTKYEATFLNWILFFLCFGFIWMWF